MALTFVEPPAMVLQTYQESLLDFLGPHAPIAQLYHLPVGTIALPDLVAGGAGKESVVLRNLCRPSGCRIFAHWPEATWISCEMTNPSLYGNALFRNFAADEAVEATFKRIAEAQALDAVSAAQYELHFLSIPAIYLEALHLVCMGAGHDLVMPLLSIDRQLGGDTVLHEAAFLAIAHSSATARVSVTSADPLSS